jgi:hypothetical protein
MAGTQARHHDAGGSQRGYMKNTKSTEYMIEWKKPDGYDPSDVLWKLPSPISHNMREIYNYSVKPDGFYLIDRHVEPATAGHAMKLFVDEALSHTDAVTVRKL